MTIAESHYQFAITMDRVHSMASPDFRPEEIDWLLNEAQRVFVKQRISALSNPKRLGFEASQKRIDDLHTLVVKYPVQPGIIPTVTNGIYEVELGSLEEVYLHLLSGFVDAEITDNCVKQIRLKHAQHDDYREAIKDDPFNGPSEEFIPYNFGRATSNNGSSVYMYPDTMVIQTVYLEYLKKPREVNLGTYTYIDGSTKPTTDFELPEDTHTEIVDLACQIASLNVLSPEYMQLKQAKVFMHE